MSAGSSSPVVGYNTGVQYGGKTYHIQTEDSGRGHPHVITHLFADGGRVIATRKTSYAPWVDTDRCAAMVKEIVLAQHKAMFVALRDGKFDDVLNAAPGSGARREEPPLALDEIERAVERAERRASESAPAAPAPPATPSPTPPAKPTPARAAAPASGSEGAVRTFAPRIPVLDATERSIDDVILDELAAFLDRRGEE